MTHSSARSLLARGSALLAASALAITLAPGVASAAVINGNDNDNSLEGTETADTIHGNGGNDRILGLGGNDALYGDTGSDLIGGGGGRDTLWGGYGDDRLYADFESGDLADPVSGDTVYAGPGNDTVFARDGEADTVTCGDGGRDVAVLDTRDTLASGHGCEFVNRAGDRNDGADITAERAVEWARTFTGKTEQQLYDLGFFQVWTARTGNGTPGPHDIAWCGIYAHEAYYQAGKDLPNEMDYTNWLYSTTHSAFTTVAETNAKRGDLVLLDWNSDGDPDHIGMVGKDAAAGDTGLNVVSGNSSNSVTDRWEPWSEVQRVRRVN